MPFWKAGRLRDTLGWALAMLLSTSPAAAQEFAGREKLRAHGEQEFRKDVVKVADGVYVAVGYSMANVTMIVGDGGTIIVDTTSKVDDAQAVRAEFAKISRAPVRAIIYTHSHPDHTGGASVFAGTDRPEIYSHQLFVDRVPDLGRAGRDGGDQFGSTLPEALYINGGTGTEFGRPSGPAAMKTGPLPPTKTFSGDRLCADDCRRAAGAAAHTWRDQRRALGVAAGQARAAHRRSLPEGVSEPVCHPWRGAAAGA